MTIPADGHSPVRSVGAGSPLLSRRQFLWWSAVLGAGAATMRLPRLAEERPLGLGFIGLGGRGTAVLALCRELRDVQVTALCDRDREALGRAKALGETQATVGTHLGEGSRGRMPEIFATLEPAELLRQPAVEAVVLAAAATEQAAMAAAVCAAGKDLLLLRPLSLDREALRHLAALTERRRLVAHVARACRYAIDGGRASGWAARGERAAGSVLVHTRLQSPARPSTADLALELLDEADFGDAVLGGKIVRSVEIGGSGCLPERWLDRRLHLELADGMAAGGGERRSLTLAIVADRGPLATKAGQIVVRGGRGSAHLTAVPVAGCDALDLRGFLSAIRQRRPGPALTLSRSLHLLDTVLASCWP